MNLIIFTLLATFLVTPALGAYQFNQWWHVQTYEKTYRKGDVQLENRFNLFTYDEAWYDATCNQEQRVQAKRCYKEVLEKWNFRAKENKYGITVSYDRQACCVFWHLNACLKPIIAQCDEAFNDKLQLILEQVYEGANENCFPHYASSFSCYLGNKDWTVAVPTFAIIGALALVSSYFFNQYLLKKHNQEKPKANLPTYAPKDEEESIMFNKSEENIMFNKSETTF